MYIYDKKKFLFWTITRLTLNIVLEVVKYMLCKQINIEKTKIYLENTIKEKISKSRVRKIFKHIWKIIKIYYVKSLEKKIQMRFLQLMNTNSLIQ